MNDVDSRTPHVLTVGVCQAVHGHPEYGTRIEFLDSSEHNSIT